jgi:drug/metabolite transporter (DMT)-like permease
MNESEVFIKVGIMKNKLNDTIIGCLCALGCETIYGLSYIFTKSATESAGELALLGWRFLVAAIIMRICIRFHLIKINLKNKPLKPLFFIALFSPCLYFIGETIGISNTTASESGAFLACIPVASILASSLILKKKPSNLQLTGIIITLAGVLFTVFAVRTGSSFSITGYLFLFLAVISYALYGVFVDKANKYSGPEITYIMIIIGALVFIGAAFAEALIHNDVLKLVTLPVQNMSFLVAILYQGLCCSVLAFFMSNVAIAKIGVNRTSSFIGISTAVSVIAGASILNEPFTLFQIVGVVVILSGVYVANSKDMAMSR